MTLSSVISRISYSGDGSTTVFSFPYYFIDEADLVVIITDTNGTETTQTITTEYTVTGEGVSAGGSVTMITAPGATDTLTIYRDPAIKQTLDLVENDSLPAEDHEQNLDKMVMMMQRLSDRMDRAVTLSEGFSGTFSTLLPSTLTADSVLQINASGTGVSVGPTATEVSNAQTYATNAANSASAASTSATNAASSASAAASSASQAASTLASAFFNDVVFYTDADSPITLDSTANGKLLSFDTSGGAISVTLPTIASETMPFNIAFLLATAGNDLTVNRAGTDTIGAAGTSKVLSVANTGFQLAADTDTSPDRWTPLEFGSVGDGTVTTDKLADANVTRAKLATGAVAPRTSAAKTANYTVLTSEDILLGDSSGGAFTFTMPTEASASGRIFTFSKTSSDVNKITINNDAASEVTSIITNGETVKIFTDGTSWYVINRFIPSTWTSFTPTGTWTTNTTYTGFWRREGDSARIRVNIALAGAPTTATLAVVIPTSIGVMDTSKIPNVTTVSSVLGSASVLDSATSVRAAVVVYKDSDEVHVASADASSNNLVNQAVPITFASGDQVTLDFLVPITDWNN